MAIPNFDNGARDLVTVSDVANSPAHTTVTRQGATIPTLAGALAGIAVSAGLAYKTLAELQATTGTQGQMAEVTDDGENTGRYWWNNGQWEPTSPGALALAQETAEVINKAISDPYFALAFANEEDRVPLGITRAGEVVAPALDTAGLKLRFVSDHIWAIAAVDDGDKVAWGIYRSGKVFPESSGGSTTITNPVQEEVPALAYVNGSNVLSRVDVDGTERTIVDLSLYGSNLSTRPHTTGSESYITVLDRPGFGLTGQMAIALTNAEDGSSLMIHSHSKIVFVIPSVGQSNSVGSQGVDLDIPAIMSAQFAETLKMPGNTLGYGEKLTYGGTVYDPLVMQQLDPLKGNVTYGPTGSGIPLGVTHLTGLGFRLAHEFRKRMGFDPRMVVFTAGVGGQLYDQLKKGTVSYNNLLAAVQRIKDLVEPDGYTVVVPFITCVHGESDSNRKSYQQGILDWQTDLNADVKAITGQAAEIPFICSQASQFQYALDGEERQILGAEPGNQSSIGRQIWGVYPTYLACKSRTTHHMAGSYSTLDFSPDNLHLASRGHVKNGEYMALTAMATVFGNKDHGAIMPRTVTFNGTDTVDIIFDVPVLPLVRDTDISDPGSWGFELFDGDGWTMTSPTHHPGVTVTTTLTGPDSVRLVCSVPIPAGESRGVGYALQGWKVPKQPGEISRGQLRDSSTDVSLADGEPLYRWTPCFFELF